MLTSNQLELLRAGLFFRSLWHSVYQERVLPLSGKTLVLFDERSFYTATNQRRALWSIFTA